MQQPHDGNYGYGTYMPLDRQFEHGSSAQPGFGSPSMGMYPNGQQQASPLGAYSFPAAPVDFYGAGGSSNGGPSAPYMPQSSSSQSPVYPSNGRPLASPEQGSTDGNGSPTAPKPSAAKRSSGAKKKSSKASAADAAAAAAAAQAEEEHDDEADGKRRRVQRACDSCRKKKVRCNGLAPGETTCANCATYGHECTFVDAAKRRAPPRSYCDALEARMERMEQVLAQLAPGVDFTDRIGPMPRLPGEEGDEKPASAGVQPQGAILPVSVALGARDASAGPRDPAAARAPNGLKSEDEDDEDEEENEDIAYISQQFTPASNRSRTGTALQVDSCPAISIASGPLSWADAKFIGRGGQVGPNGAPVSDGSAFLGKASDFHLIELLDRISLDEGRRRGSTSGGNGALRKAFALEEMGVTSRRRMFEIVSLQNDANWNETDEDLFWPEPDLEARLIDAYFARPHHDFPVVNELQFRKDHAGPPGRERQIQHVALALGIFAVASRYVDDPRVCFEEEERLNGQTAHTAGVQWWLTQRRIGMRLWGGNMGARHAQHIILNVIFMLGTSMANSYAWALLAVAVRLLQDAGAHRNITGQRLGYSLETQETHRRLWWAVYSLDREFGAGLGRPVCIQDEDFDVLEPMAVDDEVLMRSSELGTTPEQPAGVPSAFGYFLCSIRLDQIIGRTLRTIYAIGKAKVQRGFVGRQWDQFIVAEIDSALNQWLDTVPSHLRYDPREPNSEWLLQSSLLHTKYYHSQILVHRPFIPGPSAKPSLNFPSLAICTNAARSTSHILYNLLKRDLHNQGGLQVSFRAFSAGCVLLLVVWAAKRSGAHASTSAMADVRRCLDVLHGCEKHWAIACKQSDLMERLIKVSELPVPLERGIKRAHNENSEEGPDFGDIDAVRRKLSPNGAPRRAQNSSSSSLVEHPLPLSTSELVDAFSDTQSAGSTPSRTQDPTFHHGDQASAQQQSQMMFNGNGAQHFAPPNSSDANGQLTGNQINRMFGQTPGGSGQMDFSLPSAADLTPMLGTGQGAFAGPGGSGSAAPGMFDDPFDTLFAQQHLWADEWSMPDVPGMGF